MSSLRERQNWLILEAIRTSISMPVPGIMRLQPLHPWLGQQRQYVPSQVLLLTNRQAKVNF
jgi:hypothetical protein